MMWCLPTEQRDVILQWANMTLAVWNSLCLAHQQTVTTEYFNSLLPKEGQ